MGNWKDVDKLMEKTGSIPTTYGKFIVGTERRSFIKIRRTTQSFEVERPKELAQQIKDGNIGGVAEVFISMIEDVTKVCRNMQLTEMRSVDRFNEAGRLLIRFKVPELKEIDNFIKKGEKVKELTSKNWELITAVLKDSPPRKPMVFKAKALKSLGKTEVRLAMEIEAMRREAIKYVSTQKHILKGIKKLIEKVEKDEESKKEFEATLNNFALAVDSELKIISTMILSVLILFTKIADRLENLTREDKEGYPKESKDYAKILKKFEDDGKRLSALSKDVAFTVAGNKRV